MKIREDDVRLGALKMGLHRIINNQPSRPEVRRAAETQSRRGVRSTSYPRPAPRQGQTRAVGDSCSVLRCEGGYRNTERHVPGYTTSWTKRKRKKKIKKSGERCDCDCNCNSMYEGTLRTTHYATDEVVPATHVVVHWGWEGS